MRGVPEAPWPGLRLARAQQRRRFVEVVAKEFENSRQTYGAPRLVIALRRRGIHADKQTTQTVLKALDMTIGLRGQAPRKLVLHADPDPHGYRRPYTRRIRINNRGTIRGSHLEKRQQLACKPKESYTRNNRSARLDSGREWAGSLLGLGADVLSKPVKRALTIAQHIELLRSRGMEVDDALAHQWLSYVSYYRLSAYWYPARRLTSRGVRADAFLPGTRFSDAVALYEADRKLRSLVHDGMERVEIAMRTRVGEVLSATDPLTYVDPQRFRPTFNHQRWMTTLDKRISRAHRNNEAIKHYRNCYGGNYPFWVLAEVLDFADISRLYEGLPASDQRTIAEEMGIVIDLGALSKNQQRKAKLQSPLVRWMEQLTIVRNYCAHHARLWNKSFAPAPTAALRTQPQFAALPEGQSEQVFGVLTVMSSLIRVASPGTTWPAKITSLIRRDFLPNPLVSPTSLGIPPDWNYSF
ncbi:Abi family protein [Actinobaculum suis]|uniref:Abi family protein n=1 Tax=Actinobaculum suis TaxID=1657 RepID=UPI001E49EE20|nr:Abi family protein [Actinobaculum suis]